MSIPWPVEISDTFAPALGRLCGDRRLPLCDVALRLSKGCLRRDRCGLGVVELSQVVRRGLEPEADDPVALRILGHRVAEVRDRDTTRMCNPLGAVLRGPVHRVVEVYRGIVIGAVDIGDVPAVVM